MGLPPIDCKFDIPKPFRWNESFKVFYDNLDAEHQGLFDGVFDVNAKRGDAKALAEALKRFKEHFEDEEKEMKRGVEHDSLDQDYLTLHAAAHSKFIELFQTFHTPVGDDEVDYSMKWLVNHIKGIDFKYKDKIPQ